MPPFSQNGRTEWRKVSPLANYTETTSVTSNTHTFYGIRVYQLYAI